MAKKCYGSLVLHEDCSQALIRGICFQDKRFIEIKESQHGNKGHGLFELKESLLSLWGLLKHDIHIKTQILYA